MHFHRTQLHPRELRLLLEKVYAHLSPEIQNRDSQSTDLRSKIILSQPTKMENIVDLGKHWFKIWASMGDLERKENGQPFFIPQNYKS